MTFIYPVNIFQQKYAKLTTRTIIKNEHGELGSKNFVYPLHIINKKEEKTGSTGSKFLLDNNCLTKYVFVLSFESIDPFTRFDKSNYLEPRLVLDLEQVLNTARYELKNYNICKEEIIFFVSRDFREIDLDFFRNFARMIYHHL